MTLTDADILAQIPFVLHRTDFPQLGERYEGKVRDSYVSGEKRVLITTDRLSCFDVVLTAIPFKGQVLTQLAQYWFEKTSGIVRNHLISIPDPNVMVGRNCRVLPIEVVVRGYLAGSALRDYEAGRAVSGVRFPAGLTPYAKLPEPVLTPSTKAAHGDHDEPISEAEIVERGIVERSLWAKVHDVALELFALGQGEAQKRGLLMVDTKYEFGLLGDELVLVDEIHTLDCSRYWIADSYDGLVCSGQSPVMLDKEPIRQWLLARGYKGEGTPPEFTDQHRVEIARHYIDAFERITGMTFQGVTGSVEERIRGVIGRV